MHVACLLEIVHSICCPARACIACFWLKFSVLWSRRQLLLIVMLQIVPFHAKTDMHSLQ